MAVRHPECKLTLFTHVAKEIMYLRNMEKCQCFFKLCEVKPTKQRDRELREINFQAVAYDQDVRLLVLINITYCHAHFLQRGLLESPS